MGVQLIFVVEAKKSSKSDWIYIKGTIDYFYEYNRTGLKLSPVYMDGKGNYKQKEKEVKSLISQYSKASKGNKSKVTTINFLIQSSQNVRGSIPLWIKTISLLNVCIRETPPAWTISKVRGTG